MLSGKKIYIDIFYIFDNFMCKGFNRLSWLLSGHDKKGLIPGNNEWNLDKKRKQTISSYYTVLYIIFNCMLKPIQYLQYNVIGHA